MKNGAFTSVPRDAVQGFALGLIDHHGVELNKCHGSVARSGQGFAPWHAALTDSDVVTVGDAPVTVDLVSLLRPVVSTTLFGRSLINEVPSNWTGKDTETKCCDDD